MEWAKTKREPVDGGGVNVHIVSFGVAGASKLIAKINGS